MRTSPLRLRAGPLGLIAALVLTASPPALAWREHTHKDQLTPLALDLVAQRHAESYPDEIWLACRPYIMQGAWDEDFPCGLEGIRASNHFCHPLTRHGLSDAPWAGLGDPDVCTLAWALDNPSFSPEEEFAGGEAWGYAPWGWNAADVGGGDMSWRRAVERYGYTEESRRLAYYTLGFVCHLLQDMGNPEHVHDDPHGASGYTGFEWWVWRHWDSLAPAVPGELTPRKFDTLEASLENLALLGYSAGRFHGGELNKDRPYLDPGTDLAKMFRVRGVGAGREWHLRNPDGRAILAWSSPGGGRYAVQWRDRTEPIAAGASIADVVARTLAPQPAGQEPGEVAPVPAVAPSAPLAPGVAEVRIVFSESVRGVAVAAGGQAVAGALDESETVWTGELAVESEGPPRETRTLSVYAEDKHVHFGSEGARLDGDPATPARRLPEYPAFPWSRYEAGVDSSYHVPVCRDRTDGPAAPR
jgi:hypothetical protein